MKGYGAVRPVPLIWVLNN